MQDPQAVFQQIRQIKLMQDELKDQRYESKSGDIRVVVDGNLKVIELDLPKKITETENKKIKQTISKAIQKAQKSLLCQIQKIN